MYFKVAFLTFLPTFFASTQAGLFFPLYPYPPKPAPPPAGCPSIQFKPLGSFLINPSFPNPWSGANIPLNVPNCHTPPAPPPAPACPACPPAPVCPGDEFCQPPPRFPSAQISANSRCNAQPFSPPRRACLDFTGAPKMCCY